MALVYHLALTEYPQKRWDSLAAVMAALKSMKPVVVMLMAVGLMVQVSTFVMLVMLAVPVWVMDPIQVMLDHS
jgi:hypothetical protein